jgi:hypothetical protein
MARYLAVSLICAATLSAHAEDVRSAPAPLKLPRLFVPPEHVAHWISISWAGAVNHPITPVFYLTETRTPPPLNRYVRLTEKEYILFQRFTHSVRCRKENIAAMPPYPNTIFIQEYSNQRLRSLCFLPKAGGCEYLFAVARLPGIDWSHKDTYPLFQFEAELGCKEPLTKWRDPQGRQH